MIFKTLVILLVVFCQVSMCGCSLVLNKGERHLCIYLIAGSFRVSFIINFTCPWNLGKHSGCFMILRWRPISWFVYQWRHFTIPRDSHVDYVHDVITISLSRGFCVGRGWSPSSRGDLWGISDQGLSPGELCSGSSPMHPAGTSVISS